MRNQRKASSIARSAKTSPRFLSCRQVDLSSRSGVALGDYGKSSCQSRVREPWPVFGDAVHQNETKDTVFGARQRVVAGRATEIHIRPPTTGFVRPVTLARRLRSEVGTAATATTYISSGSPIQKSSTRLSPTALDWAPKSTTSPRLPALTYADVAKIGDGRPPPPFPVLRKLNNTRTSAASTESVVRRGSKSSSLGSRDSELNDARSICELFDGVDVPDYAEAVPPLNSSKEITDSQVCPYRGLGYGLGLLAVSANEGSEVSACVDVGLHRDYSGSIYPRGEEDYAAEVTAKDSPLQSAPDETTTSRSTPSSGASVTRFIVERSLLDLLKQVKLRKISNSISSPLPPGESALGIDSIRYKQSAHRAKSRASLASLLSDPASIKGNSLLSPENRPIRDEQGGLKHAIPSQHAYPRVVNSLAPIGRCTEISVQSEFTRQASGPGEKNQCKAAWPGDHDFRYAERDKSRKLPRPRHCYTAAVGGYSRHSETDYWATEEVNDR